MASKARVQTINGITYPREVPPPPGLPPGWVGVEQAYGPGTKSAGQVYTRYKSLDGKHKQVLGPKQVVQLHCEDHGIADWEAEYAKYQQALKEKQDKLAEERIRLRELKGQCEGQKREEMITLSKMHFGVLKGEIVFGFPGWKCRWEFLPDSEQVRKTFTDPEGTEWLLLKDLECKFGTMIEKAGAVPDELAQMIEAGRNNLKAHSLFHTGAAKAKDCQGAVEFDASTAEVRSETKEERAARMREKGRGRASIINFKSAFASQDDYHEWEVTITPAGQETEASTMWNLLLARGFKDQESMLLQVAAQGQARYADVLTGFYVLQGKDASGRPCYQRVKCLSTKLVPTDCYLYWSGRWELGCRREGKECCAFSNEDRSNPAGSQNWRLLRDAFGSKASDSTDTSRPLQEETDMKKRKASPSQNESQQGASSADAASKAPRITAQTPDESLKKVAADVPAKHPEKVSASVAADVPVEKISVAAVVPAEKDSAPSCKGQVASTNPKVAGNPDWQRYAGRVQWDGVYHEEKLWKWEESTAAFSKQGSDLQERPAHWPADIKVFPGKWHPWVPDGWGQGQKLAPNGDFVMKFISPEGKVCHNRAGVQKALGGQLFLPDKRPDWPDWLPKDWRKSEKEKMGQKCSIYVTPCLTRYFRSSWEVQKSIAEGSVGHTGSILKLRPEQSSS